VIEDLVRHFVKKVACYIKYTAFKNSRQKNFRKVLLQILIPIFFEGIEVVVLRNG